MARDDMTYEEAMHAVQSGIAYAQSHGSQDGTPKHLRVGICSAMCDHCALVRLLIKKGLITEVEYIEEIRLEAIREVRRFEDRISTEYGIKITLG